MIELHEFYPAPDDLLASEIRVLDHIRNQPYIKDVQPALARDSAQYYQQNWANRNRFEFFSSLDVWHAAMDGESWTVARNKQKPSNLRLVIAARIDRLGNKAYACITYCMAVCRIRSEDRLSILRKFHFDIACSSAASPKRLQEHPQSHLQYCGDMLPRMLEMGCRQSQLDQMHPRLSEPRIFCPPMSLGMLIDMVFHEFPDQKSAKFRQDSSWRGLIHKQQRLLLAPFHKKCSQIIASDQRLADEFYVG